MKKLYGSEKKMKNLRENRSKEKKARLSLRLLKHVVCNKKIATSQAVETTFGLGCDRNRKQDSVGNTQREKS